MTTRYIFILSMMFFIQAKAQVDKKPKTPIIESTIEVTEMVKSAKDFIPGNKVLLYDDFAQSAIGDFPVNWSTNTSGEIVLINDKPQKWLQLSSKGTFTLNDIKQLPQNFTFEFEVYATKKFSFYSTFLCMGFIETKNKTEYAKWGYFVHGKDGVTLQLRPVIAAEAKNLGTARVKIYSEGKEILKNEIEFSTFNNTNANLAKVQIWRQKNRIRMYVNGFKIWDLPNAFQKNNYNAIVFFINDYKTPADKYYISNLRLAEAGADTRHQLIETGTFSTSEILFDVNKSTIKSSSAAVLTELGKALQENPGVKISITGHTDSDGTETANQLLSEQRAESVKSYLAVNFSIDNARMTTLGKGESEPVTDNASEEGKIKNRRVEFKVIR